MTSTNIPSWGEIHMRWMPQRWSCSSSKCWNNQLLIHLSHTLRSLVSDIRIVSSLTGPRPECRTKSGGVQGGKKNDFRANRLLIPSSTPPHPQPRACIEGLGLTFIWIASAGAEWSVAEPWLGWGSVKGEARSAKWTRPPPPPPVRVCMLEQQVQGCAERTVKCDSIKPTGRMNE